MGLEHRQSIRGLEGCNGAIPEGAVASVDLHGSALQPGEAPTEDTKLPEHGLRIGKMGFGKGQTELPEHLTQGNIKLILKSQEPCKQRSVGRDQRSHATTGLSPANVIQTLVIGEEGPCIALNR